MQRNTKPKGNDKDAGVWVFVIYITVCFVLPVVIVLVTNARFEGTL